MFGLVVKMWRYVWISPATFFPFCVSVIVFLSSPAVTVMVAVRTAASVFSETVTVKLSAALVTAKLASSLDVTSHSAWLVFTVNVRVCPAAGIFVSYLPGVIVRTGLLGSTR